jgi:hypothetical protein
MIATVAGRERAPAPATVARERRLHVQQVHGHRFVVGWGVKRSATVIPAPLRFWQYRPASPVAIGAVAVIVAVWLGAFGWVGGWSAVRGELPLALIAGVGVLVLSTGRLTVSDHGVSFDAAGIRTDAETIVPLVTLREVRLGGPPDGWPAPKRRGGRWPGRTRVAVRHLTDDGAARAFTVWVRDPDAFAAAIGVPLDR